MNSLELSYNTLTQTTASVTRSSAINSNISVTLTHCTNIVVLCVLEEDAQLTQTDRMMLTFSWVSKTIA